VFLGGAVFLPVAYVVLQRVLQLFGLLCQSTEFNELAFVVLRHELAVLRRQSAGPDGFEPSKTIAFGPRGSRAYLQHMPRASGNERHVPLFKNGRNQALRIPRDLELPGQEAILRKEGRRLVVEPIARPSLLALPSKLKPLDEDFPPN
jgi:antitoxin VapB